MCPSRWKYTCIVPWVSSMLKEYKTEKMLTLWMLVIYQSGFTVSWQYLSQRLYYSMSVAKRSGERVSVLSTSFMDLRETNISCVPTGRVCLSFINDQKIWCRVTKFDT